jgi:hypothetical protein
MQLTWDGRAQGGQMAGSGVYYLRARSGNTTISHKLLLLP